MWCWLCCVQLGSQTSNAWKDDLIRLERIEKEKQQKERKRKEKQTHTWGAKQAMRGRMRKEIFHARCSQVDY
jgi:hypothetical protein